MYFRFFRKIIKIFYDTCYNIKFFSIRNNKWNIFYIISGIIGT